MKKFFHPSMIVFGLIFLLFAITLSFKALDYMYPDNSSASKQTMNQEK
ncbi:MAG: hypothetical protein ACJ75J_13650 [Cytophagaceae bacterium]